MSHQIHKKRVSIYKPKLSIPRKHSLQKLYQDVVIINFYQTLTKKAKYNPSAFRSKKNSQTLILPQSKNSKYFALGEETVQRKSPHNIRNLLLPSLKPRRQSVKYEQKMISNGSVFVHQKIPVKAFEQVSLERQNSKTKNPIVILDNPEQKATSGNKPKLMKISAASTQLLQDMAIVEMLTPMSNSQSSQRRKGFLTRVKSSDKIAKTQSEKIYEYPVSLANEDLKIKLHPMDIERGDSKLLKNLYKIEKTLNFYRMKKQRQHEQSLVNPKNFVNQVYEEMESIKIKGQHTIYCVKQKESKRQSPRRKVIQSFMPKIKFQNWKTKDFPFDDLLKSEVNKLFSYYLGLKEVVPIPSGYYKVYAGQGNNGTLVARLLKNKGWWSVTEDINEAHLVWTQHPHPQLMEKIYSNSSIQLKQQRSGNFDIPTNDIHSVEAQQIKQFLSIKSNNFLESCSKLLHPITYHKVIVEFIQRFKENLSVKKYVSIKNIVSSVQTKQISVKEQAKYTKLFNHCENSQEIGDKKNLLFHIQKYCEINKLDKNQIIPRTKHVTEDEINVLKNSSNKLQNISSLLAEFQEQEALYILKPGEDSNRGNGITVHSNKTGLIQHISKSVLNFPQSKTYIVQQYIDPLLYQGRKFDIRIWVLFANNKLWFYRQGYVRTSCKQFTIKSMNKFIHLTNDAVQKYSDQYGKYQPANKVSFSQMDKYLKAVCSYNGFYTQIYEKIKNLTKILFESGMLVMGRHAQQFQLFGLDFLIDKKFNVWLIQCNKNPSIEVCCSLLNRLVPNMIENVITIAIDPHFPPNQRRAVKEESEWVNERFNFEMLSDCNLQTSYQSKIKNDKEYLEYMRKINPFKLQRMGRQNK